MCIRDRYEDVNHLPIVDNIAMPQKCRLENCKRCSKIKCEKCKNYLCLSKNKTVKKFNYQEATAMQSNVHFNIFKVV